MFSFYEQLPFNYRADADAHAGQLRRADPIRSYPPLAAILTKDTRLLDIGCGAGWLPLSAAYWYRCSAVGLDFNPVAIARARDVAQALGVQVRFEVADLFNFSPIERFSLVTSLGVLHHTNDCVGGLAHIANSILGANGRMFIGLYHADGRRPFLSHFAKLKSGGASVDDLYAEFARLRSPAGGQQDGTFTRSWFRDQVLHPHATQHTLAASFRCWMTSGSSLSRLR